MRISRASEFVTLEAGRIDSPIPPREISYSKGSQSQKLDAALEPLANPKDVSSVNLLPSQVVEVNESLAGYRAEVQFLMSPDSNGVTLRIVDVQTGKVIVEIPRELVDLSRLTGQDSDRGFLRQTYV
jgi:uncharacterized FlaG/YvyC family protein